MQRRATRFAIRFWFGKLFIIVRFILLLIVLGLLGGCAEPQIYKPDKHDPVPGEATPAPETGPRGGWAW